MLSGHEVPKNYIIIRSFLQLPQGNPLMCLITATR
jgi:hypothetical protein